MSRSLPGENAGCRPITWASRTWPRRKLEWQSEKYKKTVDETTSRAQKLGLTGTPSFSIEGQESDGMEWLNTPGSTEAIEKAEKGSSSRGRCSLGSVLIR
jgi:hypothetical protein